MSDPQRRFATDVVRRLRDAGYTALWAGGCVRDLVMGRPPQDYDVATNARPEQVRELFGRRRTLAVGQSFGVIVVLGPRGSGQVEVATFRTEGPYRGGRWPESVEFCTPEEDARRRDFTINGMFYDPLTETLHDYVGGEHDLGEGIVRAIGDPRARMTEDKLRMLRAVRFAATLEFELDERTADAVREMATGMLIVSSERITQELRKMLTDAHRERAMRLCHELGLLTVIFPELAPLFEESPEPRQWWQTLHVLGNLESPSFELASAALLRTVPAPPGKTKPHEEPEGTVRGVCRRLRFSNRETEHINWLVAHQRALDGSPSLSLAELKRLLTHEWIADLFQLARHTAEAGQHPTEGIDFAAACRESTPAEVLNPPQLVTGGDLRALGLPPGPRYREILTAVRDAQLNEELGTRDEALALAKRLAASAEE